MATLSELNTYQQPHSLRPGFIVSPEPTICLHCRLAVSPLATLCSIPTLSSPFDFHAPTIPLLTPHPIHPGTDLQPGQVQLQPRYKYRKPAICCLPSPTASRPYRNLSGTLNASPPLSDSSRSTVALARVPPRRQRDEDPLSMSPSSREAAA